MAWRSCRWRRGGTLTLYKMMGGRYLLSPDGLFETVRVSGFSAPAFADLDGDGDFDLLVDKNGDLAFATAGTLRCRVTRRLVATMTHQQSEANAHPPRHCSTTSTEIWTLIS